MWIDWHAKRSLDCASDPPIYPSLVYGVAAHRFQNKYFDLYAAEHGEDSNSLLSARESEVIKWLAYGKTVPVVAMILKRSPETIKYHIKNIYSKLGVCNRGHAISQAAKLGLL
jgi:DNA-binding CsgD family transcriptional regulator